MILKVNSETKKQFRYGEIGKWTEVCVDRLKELGLGPSSRLAVVVANCPEVLFVHLAAASIPTICASINPQATTG